MGQSAMASEPSSMPSVSRSGLATEPESRWSRPMTIGADTFPLRTSSLKASPATCRSRSPTSKYARAALDSGPFPARSEANAAVRHHRGSASAMVICCGEVFGSSRQAGPPKRPGPPREQRTDVGHEHKTGILESVDNTSIESLSAQPIAVVEGNGTSRFRSTIAWQCLAIDPLARSTYSDWAWRRATRAPPPSVMSLGTYPFSASCADVWSVTMSGIHRGPPARGKRRHSCRRPQPKGRDLRLGRFAATDASSRSSAISSSIDARVRRSSPPRVDLDAQGYATVPRDRERLCATHPASPPVRVMVPGGPRKCCCATSAKVANVPCRMP